MRLLAIDPGAERSGWAFCDTTDYSGSSRSTLWHTGIVAYPRAKRPFQQYRMELAQEWVSIAEGLLFECKPQILVSEIVPSRGFNIPEQAYLANVQITTLHALALAKGVEVKQVSARTVQSKIAIQRKKSPKVTKIQVRNGVIERLPYMKDALISDGKIAERSDALAIALNYLEENPEKS